MTEIVMAGVKNLGKDLVKGRLKDPVREGLQENHRPGQPPPAFSQWQAPAQKPPACASPAVAPPPPRTAWQARCQPGCRTLRKAPAPKREAQRLPRSAAQGRSKLRARNGTRLGTRLGTRWGAQSQGEGSCVTDFAGQRCPILKCVATPPPALARGVCHLCIGS